MVSVCLCGSHELSVLILDGMHVEGQIVLSTIYVCGYGYIPIIRTVGTIGEGSQNKTP
jgi:hypothetical protein